MWCNQYLSNSYFSSGAILLCFTGEKWKVVLQASNGECWGTASSCVHSDCWWGLPEIWKHFQASPGPLHQFEREVYFLKAFVFIISCIALNQIMNDCHLLGGRFLKSWKIGQRRLFKLLLWLMVSVYWGLGILAARYGISDSEFQYV